MEKGMLLNLQEGILYGPVNSRRYGRSLGINLMPGAYKLCSFNCVYCHYGWTRTCTMDMQSHAADLPAFEKVVSSLEEALKKPIRLDLITFSGNGEPTLYPRFPELVDAVVTLRNRYKPDARVALLSNATGLVLKEVRECVAKIDLPVLKLDAGTEEVFQAINRPAQGIHLKGIVECLSSLENIYLQTVFMDGSPSNTGPGALSVYYELVKKIHPREVHLYSIDRPVPNRQIVLVSPERLEAIAGRILEKTGIPARAYYI